MDERERLAERFEEQRPHLRAVAYRMLGSLSEADDAVQEAWLRLSGTDSSAVENLAGWLTTVVARICLNMLRSRQQRGEEPLEGRLPDPIISREDGGDPEQEALLANSVGLALLVVLDTLAPAERLSFVLHDMFGVPFDEIAPIIERTPAAARQLASRGRRRVHGQVPAPDPDLARQREVVNAFFAAAREGNFGRLVAVLDPDVAEWVDVGLAAGGLLTMRGSENVASRALRYTQLAALVRPALINGTAGVVVVMDGQVFSVMAFTVTNGKIVAMHIFRDPERLANIDPAVLD